MRAAAAALAAFGAYSGCCGQPSNDSREASSSTISRDYCLQEAYPHARSDFPALLNCLGLVGEALEVGVQAGVHASHLLQTWKGQRLRLVDKWTHQAGNQIFYVDIANLDGVHMRERHRAQCEERLANELASGRAEIIQSDSVSAASKVQDGELDFVYLDARHDFSGVVADVHAWWPKVKIGGIFAGHDYVDGEFPEGDFFWISALKAILPELMGQVLVTSEVGRYPSFFVIKTEGMAQLAPRNIQADAHAKRLYAEASHYFRLWRNLQTQGTGSSGFPSVCAEYCGKACDERVRHFTPTRSAASTLRPFSCSAPPTSHRTESDSAVTSDTCKTEVDLDVKAYHDICIERCNVTCGQRGALFTALGDEIMSASALL